MGKSVKTLIKITRMSQCVNFGSPSFDMFLTPLWFVSSAVVAHVPCLGSGLLSVWPERPKMPVLHDGEFKPGSPAGATGLQASAVVCIPTSTARELHPPAFVLHGVCAPP